MEPRASVHEGMWVISADAMHLGRVVACGELGFTIEKGTFLVEDLNVPYDDVARIDEGQIVLARRRHDYVEASNAEPIVTEDELDEAARGELAPEAIERTRRKAS